ncbi:MBL fold metallo-hydrolase [Streptomonospora nanhaiensis]|uniref:Glyoxylase-like metal-dependent hydrolase (Beta-lactamase superfamily II) n=1 Tax=Streptomonospora nanhaiensis TaxID=1323731 RepID=A0A853BVR8_9ACTN|nr:MBL fold metallo-hydrolase [Streptomonospora nanhaiensis]MBV2364521.1 MBL fold metallo-hydrolase [Streptomonospora nanhaiensis]MBX9388055.1 MBL fold metallo-hydrolase [Streptomonospora nanhaiensis]NYI99134.1 glyoxylase-like metal-dependent hydrolase (beta-lactamase superfamily II) [Streptomonospora nanhaiensis]
MSTIAADHAERLRRPAGIRSLRLGDTRVTYLPDGAVLLPPRGWLPDTTEEVWAAHPEYLDATGHLVASIGGLLVEYGGRALLIDSGFGPRSLPADPQTPRGPIHGGALLDSLARAGRRPEDVEAVAFTHLHPDHLGWVEDPSPGTDRPPFAHAAHLVSEPEWAGHAGLTAGGMAGTVAALAPRVRTVADGEEVFPGVRVRITAGHTAGHAEYVITGGGQRLIAFGDSLHSPIQVGHPEWSAAVDHDPARSAGHRRALAAELEEPGTIGFGIHFADAQFGRVRRDGGGARVWAPLAD